ncbi:MAG: exodeoxyribonuclease beta subunit [Verrucomicrobiota bacterium]|jgi:exodeoxyribonuclease V beta subunit
MTPFQLSTTPLEPGASLIQASAGTGKTHTIAGIFVRLLVESAAMRRPIGIDEILVVTYTDSATEELRDRIRKLLALAVRAFATGRSGSPFIAELLKVHDAERGRLRDHLVVALNCFDMAPIFTIHGFCQRVLKDRAFESGALFDAEVLPDQSALLREIADDFWRRQFYDASPLRVASALRQGLAPGVFLRFLRSCLSHAELQFLARAGGTSAEQLGVQLEALFESIRSAWLGGQGAVRQKFANATEWGNKPYNDPSIVEGQFQALETLLNGPDIAPGTLDALDFFAADSIAERARKKSSTPPPRDVLFDCCAEFRQREAEFITALQRDFVAFARTELRLRKARLKVLSYDDLLTRLRDALRGSGGAALSAQLRAQYRVALIDEFQDTDPVQCEIFSRIFNTPNDPLADPAHAGEAESRTALFLIGDPKQAIYGFRGADIFTYMKAEEHVHRRFTLGENWRSSSGLVRAVNTLFGSAARPFLFAKIPFDPVLAKGEANRRPLLIDGKTEAALQIWFCRREGKSIGKGDAEQHLAEATACEIARLLNGRVTIGGDPLRPQDIAVLTMTHRQAAQVQAALRRLRVPSVQQTQASVFASLEARQMLTLLTAIAAPRHEPYLRAALATDLLGNSGTRIGTMDAAEWSGHLDRFREWSELWMGRGFIAMFRELIDSQNVRARLLANPDGERSLTNILHLAEALHDAALGEKLGASGLVQWLATRLEEQDAGEEHQLRLERDENAVQLVTVHKSKGLQYEIVFAPFCWRDSELKRANVRDDDQEVLFHDPASGALVRDLGPGHALDNVRLAKRERLAENVRLLYVAVTRAKHRCYLAWGAFKGAETSAPAWLLHRGPPAAVGASTDAAGIEPEADEASAAWPLDFSGMPDEALITDLDELAVRSRDPEGEAAIAIVPLPSGAASIYQPPSGAADRLVCREFKGTVPRDWRVASFSGLTAGQRDESPDHDAADAPSLLAPAALPPLSKDIFAFPRGSKAGTCLHKIFEKLDFATADSRALEDLTRTTLREYGFSADEFTDVVAAAVRRTLAVPLVPGEPAMKLSSVTSAERLNELEFCFPLRKTSVPDLVEVFARHGRAVVQGDFPEQLGRLTFSPARGFIKGFMDLVFRFDGRFWLADWKSNWLGAEGAAYGQEMMRREMNERFYVLQYHLYVVALDRWLRLRVPGYNYSRDFGGVFYLFLRGMDPSHPERGLFQDRPEAKLIEALAAVLLDPESK